jgi:ubiquinone biosynthesis protein Coq4
LAQDRWEDHWERDLAEVRREFSIEPFRAA